MPTPRTPIFALVLAVLLASVIAAGPASATSVVRLSLSEMAAASPTIVHGTVVGVSSRWNADRSLIVTDVRVRVESALKGAPPAEVTLVQPGGEVGKLRVDVPGAAAFRPGEEAVLFLIPDRAGALHVTGLSQGRFEVTRDPRTGGKLVHGLAEPLPAPGAGKPGAVRVTVEGTGTGTVGLDRFLDGIRVLVGETGGKGGR